MATVELSQQQNGRVTELPEDYRVVGVVHEEIAARERLNLLLRLKQAQFPAPKTLEGFDPEASELAPATFASLTSLAWLQRGENLCLAGPVGTGKSHLGQALGRAAVEAGQRVRFFGADDLIEALHRGLADNTVGRLIANLLRNELVIIDDLGFTALDRTAAEQLFRFIAAAYERRSLIVTTNVAFERWTEFLPDETVATAILDRLLHHCHVIALAGESYRLRESRRLSMPGLRRASAA